MPIVTRGGGRLYRLPPHRRALAYLRRHDTPARIAAGFGISVGTRPRPRHHRDRLTPPAAPRDSPGRCAGTIPGSSCRTARSPSATAPATRPSTVATA